MDKKKKVLLMAIVCAFLSFIFLWLTIDKAMGRVEIVVAATDIEARSPIKDSMVKVISFSEEDRDKLPGAVTDKNQIIEQYTTTSIPAGTPILKSMLADKNAQTSNGIMFPNDSIRAVPVELTGLTMAGIVKKDDIVDVYWMSKKDSVGNNIGKLVFQQVKIYDTYEFDGKKYARVMLKPNEAEQLYVFTNTGVLAFGLSPVNSRAVMTTGADLKSALQAIGLRIF